MKKLFSIFLAVALLITAAGCENHQDEIYRQAAYAVSSEPELPSDPQDLLSHPNLAGNVPESLPERPEPVSDDSLSGELTVKMYYWKGDPPAIQLLAREFMDLHPNVKINFDYELDLYENATLTNAERAQRGDRYYTRLRTELMSGGADYLIYRSAEGLNSYQLAQNGVLLDLRPYWENDPDIHTDDYFADVLEAFSVEGKLPVIPFSFYCPAVFLNREVMEGLGVDVNSCFTIDSGNILEWYEQARNTWPDLQLFFSASGKDTLFSAEKTNYMDLDRKKASFNSPEFVQFLERTNAAINDDPDLDQENDIGYCTAGIADELLRCRATGKEPLTFGPEITWAYRIATKGRVSLATVEVMEMFNLTAFDQPFEYMAGPFPLTDSSGRLSITSDHDFAIPASMKNPELAWEFIKYCIRERESMDFAQYGYWNTFYTEELPLNKHNFSLAAESFSETLKGGISFGRGDLEPVDVALVTKRLEEILDRELVHANHYDINVTEYLDEYYEMGLTTAQECANKIQGRTELWLGE